MENQNRIFQVLTRYEFEGIYNIEADSADEARRIAERDCGLVLGGNIHTSNDEAVKHWEFNTHPETVIIDVNSSAKSGVEQRPPKKFIPPSSLSVPVCMQAKVPKKYALASYFQYRREGWPDTLTQIAAYLRQHGELPFEYEGKDWTYDVICTRQKKYGVARSQYLTPDAVCDLIATLARQYFSSGQPVMDACCGTGRLAACLSEKGFNVSGFDLDEELLMLGRIQYPEIETFASDFRQVVDYFPQIVANPPFESKDSIEFLQWLASVQEAGDHALLVVPKGFFDKDRPKAFVEARNRFEILHRECPQVSFERTNFNYEVVVLRMIQ